MSNTKIILVGNGTKIQESKLGDTIDSFDLVVRFNNYEIEGYEEYVGTKTDIWATRVCETIKNRDTKGLKAIFGIMNWCRYTPAIRRLAPKFSSKYPEITFIYDEQVRRYSEKFGYNPQNKWLSVGMITLLHLLDLDYAPIYICGFGGDKSKHYFPMKPQGEEFHDFEAEAKYLNQLGEEGRVIRVGT